MLLVVFFFFLVDGSVFPYALAAGLVGVFTRDIGALLQFKLNWPTLDRVIDWRAVESELSKS